MMNILPGIGIGHFLLKAHINELYQIEDLSQTSERTFRNDDFIIRIDAEKKIDLISLYNNSSYDYQGINLDKTFTQVISTGKVLLFDDFDQNFYLKETEGIGLETVNKHLSLTNILQSKIGMITVFQADILWKDLKNSFEEIDKEKLQLILEQK